MHAKTREVDEFNSVTEQPFKIPYYATLLRLLHEKSSNGTEDEVPLGRLVLDEFWKAFQGYVDQLAWREVRLCVSGLRFILLRLPLKAEQIHFFAHLTVAKLISAESMLALLQSFTAVLDEFGVSNGRAKRACMCAGEGMMIVGAPRSVNYSRVDLQFSCL